jgi:hypothetical protein
MSVGFPSDVPVTAIQQIGKFVTKSDSDLGRAALAAWQVLGYAGYQVFGPVQLLTTDAGPAPTHEDFKSLVDGTVDLKSLPPWLIPLAIQILLRFLERFKQ